MNPKRVLAVALLLAASPTFAGGLYGSVGGWRYELAGTATDAGTVYDFERDLDIRGHGRRSLELGWDTGPGWWPDLLLTYSQLDASGARTFANPFPIPGSRSLAASADNDDYDLTARYPLWSGRLSASAGVTLKRLSGTIVIEDSDQPQPSRQRFDEIIPQAHLQLQWNLSSLLVLGATGQGVEYQGDRALEWRVLAGLRLFQPVTVEFGWQEKSYELTSGNYALDARLRGALLRVGVLLPR